jgi:GT2 family glycosyltransferase
MSVSIVIPSYNRTEDLRRCLASISAAGSEIAPVEVIVSASSYKPEDLEPIEASGVKVVKSDARLLVSVARNRGASVASGTYLLFLDDDNVIDAKSIAHLVECLSVHRDVAMAGPVMYYGSQPSRVWCAGVRRSRVLGRTSLVSALPDPLPELLVSEDFPNCFMVRRSDFLAIGGFDATLFPMHYEESDLAERLRKAGLGEAVCVTAAHVWHFIEPGLTRYLHLTDPERAYGASRGRALFTAKHGDTLAWLAYVLVGQFLFAGFYLGPGLAGLTWPRRRELATAYLRGLRDGLAIGRRVRHAGTWKSSELPR